MKKSIPSKSDVDQSKVVKRVDGYNIGLDLLKEVDDFNLRNYEDKDVKDHIEQLAEAYARGDFVPDLIVRKAGKEEDEATGKLIEKYAIVDGHCRYRAAVLARDRGVNINSLRCRVDVFDEAARLVTMLKCSDGALKLKVPETAEGYVRMKRMNMSTKEIAIAVGKSVEWVSALLTFSGACEDVKELVRKDLVAVEVAVKAVRDHGDSAGEWLKHRLAEAKRASNKKKLTIKGLDPWRLPPKVSARVIDMVEKSYASLDESVLDEISALESLPEEERKGHRVEVSGDVLLCLAQMHDTIRNTREMQAARSAKRAEKQRAEDEGGSDTDPGEVETTAASGVKKASPHKGGKATRSSLGTCCFEMGASENTAAMDLFDIPAVHECRHERLLEDCAAH